MAAAAGEIVTIERAFDNYDADDSGAIDVAELQALCEELDAALSPDELDDAVKALDADGSGKIEKSEFVNWWTGKTGTGGKIGKKLANLADVGKKKHYTDIHVASWRGNVDVMRTFLELDRSLARARDSTEYGEDNTPLHYAAYAGHAEAVNLLLDEGADLNARNAAGCTPVFLASQQGQEAALTALMERGADISIADNVHKFTAVDVAATPSIKATLIETGGFSKPGVIAPPTARLVRAGYVRVEWEAPEAEYGALPPIGYRMIVKRVWAAAVDGAMDDGKLEEGDGVQVGELTTAADVLTAHVQGLTIGNSYTFCVAAVNGVGEGDMSEPCEPMTFLRTPAKPSAPVLVEREGTTRVEVMWTEPACRGSAITGYQLMRRVPDDPAAPPPVVLNSYPAGTRGATLTADDMPTPFAPFELVLVATNAVGNSAISPPLLVELQSASKSRDFGHAHAKRRASGAGSAGGRSASKGTSRQGRSARAKAAGGGTKRRSAAAGKSSGGDGDVDMGEVGGDADESVGAPAPLDGVGAWDGAAGAAAGAPTPLDSGATPGIEDAAADEFATNVLAQRVAAEDEEDEGGSSEAATDDGGGDY